MQKRRLGRTGLEVSVLGYGAGAVGGLFTKGAAADQERAVVRAIEAGINYFDTAALYGNGESERNLGRVLKALKADVIVGTKVRLSAEHRANVGKAIEQGMNDSLSRMGRDHVDLFQLHNPLVAKDAGEGSAHELLQPADDRRLTSMFVAIVQIPMSKRPRDAAVAAAAKSAPTYTALGAKGLVRKYYLNGEAGGGVYLWESEAAARAWYTPEWEKRMEAAFGAKPKVTYYDNHVVVDNEAGKVRVEGEK